MTTLGGPDAAQLDAPDEAHDVARDAGGLAPERFEQLARIIEEVEALPTEHPDAVAVRHAVAGLYKSVKVRRRNERRAKVLAHDAAVTARTATGAPGRIDDETAGIPLESTARGAIAGELIQPRGCYVCKTRYTQVDAFYHQLCPECAAFSHARRDARADLTGKRALLTGGRAKIGMYIALRLLRDGAHTTITTRFPNDAARRFAALEDSGEWLHRLRIVGIDLRDPAQVVALADDVAAQGPLDIVINNAAQTVRRSAAAYAPLVAAEAEPLPAGPLPEIVTFGRAAADMQLGPGVTAGADAEGQVAPHGEDAPTHWAPTPHALASLAMTARSATFDRIAVGQAIDAGGLVPDLADSNSWVQKVEEVDPIELLEVQLCNQTAPFILLSRLRPALAAAAKASPSGRAHVVNVSAMEGQFGRGYKGPGHPHTNMAKAALNMLTRTSAQELFESDRVLMTAVDTGWITDERPHPDRQRLAEVGFHAPLDLVDGAARVYDPIVRGEAGEDAYGVFLKDYRPAAW
jgi:NAD(P)-dependent dehydrogenase (short-subunit alcohol dehydrogenase family)